ncbi:hypothetical protein ACFPN1_02985 [Lysobacter yangpyeongensis]|uniref:EF-hand domain-containing protein n=1 Tax=Lysobacter yangpyeongensis TaxID=346182 RepID=A0ABW0SK91_9GAMM
MNTRKCISVAAASLFVAATLPAAAQTPAPRAAASAQAANRGIETIFNALDTDRNRTLSLQEFQAGYPGMARAVVLEMRLRDQFQALDTNRSGAIEQAEYGNLEFVKRAGKAAPSFGAFDADKSQGLNFAEYLAALRRLSAAQPAAPAAKK